MLISTVDAAIKTDHSGIVKIFEISGTHNHDAFRQLAAFTRSDCHWLCGLEKSNVHKNELFRQNVITVFKWLQAIYTDEKDCGQLMTRNWHEASVKSVRIKNHVDPLFGL